MKHYGIKIELLSDLCVSDGGVYNSSLDTDICYDLYGLPYIPAKRLRGCLRECAQELMDWGIDGDLEALFGTADKEAGVRIGNAYLADADALKKEIFDGNGSTLFHKQNVLNFFTSVRTQTSIDYNTGVAEENTLRTTRVVNKGTVFVADVSMGKVPEQAEFLEKCCNVLRHMGMARTRGFGEVEVSFFAYEPKDRRQDRTVKVCSLEEGANCLSYTLLLEEPILCKSVHNDESKTMDYIEGGKILGMIAQHLKNKGMDYGEFLSLGALNCTNVYPVCPGTDDVRMLEVPACVYSIKNDKTYYVNKAYEMWKSKEQEERETVLQLNSMKHCYVTERNGKLQTYSVETEKRYHHRRPEDKSFGHVTKDGVFYQVTGIAAGQRFIGRIYGSPEQIRLLYELFSENEVKYIGGSKNSEYGKVIMESMAAEKSAIEKLRGENEKKQYLLVKLEAPAIVYNDNAVYSVNTEDLVEEVNAALGLTGMKPEKRYVRYTSVGGYNVTWGCRKPSLEVFDKGTVFLYATEEAFEVPCCGFLGERTEEGYGEFSVRKIEAVSGDTGTAENGYLGLLYKDTEEEEQIRIQVNKGTFAEKICNKLWEEFVRVKAAQAAKKHTLSERLRPTVSNLLSMCSECDSVEKIELSAKLRYEKVGDDKQQKLREAEEIFRHVANVMKKTEDGTLALVTEFNERYGVEKAEYEEKELKLAYLKAYLLELKYCLRAKNDKKAGKAA